jgi:type I restriction enzyme S subunit
MDVRVFRLREVGTIYDGPHATPDRSDSGPYYLNISSLVQGRLVLENSDHVSEDVFRKRVRRVEPQGGDLLFSYETRLGEAALFPAGIRACLGRRMGLIRPHREVVDPSFLLYLYLGPDVQRTIATNSVHGATVDRISLSTMGDWLVRLPSLPEQRRISSVLRSLDEKISANNEVMKSVIHLLGLKFEHAVRMAEPRDSFGALCKVGGGGTPSTKVPEYWGGDILWVTPTDLSGLSAPYLRETAKTITDLGLSNCSSPVYPAGTILMTSRATLGSFAVTESPAAVNQGFIAVRPRRPDLLWWVFADMVSRVPEFRSHANGVTFLELSRGCFRNLPVRLADEGLMLAYCAEAEQLHALASVLSRENKELVQLRDLLLPHLLSGRLRVRDAETIVSDVV